jgi:hypothetical protein
MQKLNFPSYEFRLKNSENKTLIYDEIRKKFVVLQPEEWVRQHCIKYLITEKKYSKSLINVEKTIIVNNLKKRYDIVIYNSDGSIHLIVECKSFKISITQKTFDQIARYNLALNATYLMVTNGMDHYFAQLIVDKKHYNFLRDFPKFRG